MHPAADAGTLHRIRARDTARGVRLPPSGARRRPGAAAAIAPRDIARRSRADNAWQSTDAVTFAKAAKSDASGMYQPDRLSTTVQYLSGKKSWARSPMPARSQSGTRTRPKLSIRILFPKKVLLTRPAATPSESYSSSAEGPDREQRDQWLDCLQRLANREQFFRRGGFFLCDGLETRVVVFEPNAVKPAQRLSRPGRNSWSEAGRRGLALQPSDGYKKAAARFYALSPRQRSPRRPDK